MSEVKWIRLSINMFDNRKIKYLRSLPEGNSIILIWVMLLTIAGRCNAGGMIFLTETIPYTTKMLADELNFEENTVILAINALRQLGMIDNRDDTMFITGWEEHQNTNGLEKIRKQTKDRVAKCREKHKELSCEIAKDEDVTQCNVMVTHDATKRNVTVTTDAAQCNATDIELEIEKDKNKKYIVHEARALFEKLWKLYPLKRGKGQVSNTAKKRLLDIGYDEMLRAIARYKADLQRETWRKPQNGSTFFNSGYVDYLDENYDGKGGMDKNGEPGENTGTREAGLVEQAIAAGIGTDLTGIGRFS